MDTLGIEPRAFRMRSGCDTTTPCARHSQLACMLVVEVKSTGQSDARGRSVDGGLAPGGWSLGRSVGLVVVVVVVCVWWWVVGGVVWCGVV